MFGIAVYQRFVPLGTVTLPSAFFEVPPIIAFTGRFAAANSRCIHGQGTSITVDEGSAVVVQSGAALTITTEQSGLRYSGVLAGDQVTVTAAFDVGQSHCTTTIRGTIFSSDAGLFSENIVCSDGSSAICTFGLQRIP
jgi:hypothetical protein